jgi:hypothetical protein
VCADDEAGLHDFLEVADGGGPEADACTASASLVLTDVAGPVGTQPVADDGIVVPGDQPADALT